MLVGALLPAIYTRPLLSPSSYFRSYFSEERKGGQGACINCFRLPVLGHVYRPPPQVHGKIMRRASVHCLFSLLSLSLSFLLLPSHPLLKKTKTKSNCSHPHTFIYTATHRQREQMGLLSKAPPPPSAGWYVPYKVSVHVCACVY